MQHIDRLAKFFVRENGPSLKLFKIKSLNQLTAVERLLAAILREDRDSAEQLFNDQGSHEIGHELLEFVRSEKMNYLVLEKIVELDLVSHFKDDDRRELNRNASEESSVGRRADRAFAELLRLLAEFQDQLVFIKGAALARTVYRGPAYRPTGDYDVVVHPKVVTGVTEALFGAGYGCLEGPGFCNQYAVGPTDSAAALMIAPHRDWTPTSFMAIRRGDSAVIDVKVSPLDRGVLMPELEQFFHSATEHRCSGERFRTPSFVYHLLLLLHNFEKDKFSGFKHLYDVHLLACEIAKTPSLWEQFVAACKANAVEASAWAGLSMSVDRFASPIPPAILDELAPPETLWQHLFQYAASTYFVWNATSLPMMLLNASVSSDGGRKISILACSFLPARAFLTEYYNGGRPVGLLSFVKCLVMHWLLLVLPGGAIRKTFGRRHWPWVQPEVAMRKRSTEPVR